MRRAVMAMLATALALVSLAIPAAGSAMPGTVAPAATGECTLTGRICVWNEPAFNDTYGAYSTQVVHFPPERDNNIESVANRYSEAWMFYDSPDFVTPLFCVAANVAVIDLNLYSGLANRASSARRTGSASCPSGLLALH